MSFDTLERSQASGGPVQLFLFRYGTEEGEFFAYTDHTKPITHDHGGELGEITYEPVPVERGDIVADGTLDRSALDLKLDIGTGLADLFRVYPPSAVVTLTIFQGHIDDPDDEFLAIWAGSLASANRQQSDLVLSANPVATQMRRPGLRRNYQYGCPLWLYGPACRADKAAATVPTLIIAKAGQTVTLAADWFGTFPPAKFLRGIFQWTPAGESTRFRQIIRISGDTLTLSGSITELLVGDAVEVVLGCNRRAFADEDGDCQGLHDNLVNFGGQPWIPIKNVINTNPFY